LPIARRLAALPALALEGSSRYRGSMLPENLRKDGRAFGVTKVAVEPGHVLHPDYDLRIETPRRITRTERLVVLELVPKVEGLLGFSGRWDERDGHLDIDPVGGSRSAKAKFRNGRGGYRGHHPTLLTDRLFDVDVQVPGSIVFRGVVSFGLSRQLDLSTVAPVDRLSPVESLSRRFIPGADRA
jgi:hypothetical protein